MGKTKFKSQTGKMISNMADVSCDFLAMESPKRSRRRKRMSRSMCAEDSLLASESLTHLDFIRNIGELGNSVSTIDIEKLMDRSLIKKSNKWRRSVNSHFDATDSDTPLALRRIDSFLNVECAVLEVEALTMLTELEDEHIICRNDDIYDDYDDELQNELEALNEIEMELSLELSFCNLNEQ